MAPTIVPGTSITPTQNSVFRQKRSASNDDGISFGSGSTSLFPPPKAGKEGRSLSNTSMMFGPRGSSLAPSGPPPGSFSSDLGKTNVARSVAARPELNTYLSSDVPTNDGAASERRQAEFRDKINKEIKIKIGSENLLEALISKNAKQTKDQRLRVESELSSSNRRIAELKVKLEEEVERAKRPSTPTRLSGNFSGSPLRSPLRNMDPPEGEDQEIDLETESPTYLLAEILQTLEIEGEQPDYYVERANSLVELFKRYPTLKYDLAWKIFGLRVQTMLLSDSREVVAAGYRVTRHAIADRNSLQTIRGLHTDDMVMLSLVKESKASIEREQALKFVRAFLDVKDGVLELSNAVMRTIVSVAGHNEDRLRNMAILTLTEILVKKPSLVAFAGGIAPLAAAIGDGSYPGSESLVFTFLYVVDSQQQRRLINSGDELDAAFAPLTDPLAMHDHEERMKVNARSIATMLNTWPGLFILAQKDFATIRSLLLSLFHPAPFAKDLVLDLLYDVLHIKPPSWTSSFLAGRRLTTYGRVTNLKGTSSGADLLTVNEHDSRRVNLVDHYTALILAILVQCGLLKALSDLVEEASDVPLKRKTSLLLGEVLKLANHALPVAMNSNVQTLPVLLTSALADDALDHLDATSLIYQVDSVCRTLHRSGRSKKNLNAVKASGQENAGVPRTLDSSRTKLSIEMDEIQFRGLLVESQVLNSANYLKWKWDLIHDLVEGPLLNPRRLDEAIKSTKFLKRLMGFYRPFKYRFSDARNTKPNQRYVRIGCSLFRSLLQTAEGIQYLSESKLLRQLAECLAQLDKMSGLTSIAPLFSPHRVSETLTCGYFTILGALSSDPQGLLMIGRWRMINMFYHIIELKDRDDLVQLLLGNTDFSLDSHLRIMLSKALTSSSKVIRTFSTNLLRRYATTGSSDGSSSTTSVAFWAIRLLVTQLYDPEMEVAEVAVQILEAACNRTQYLEYVVKCRPALDHLGEIGAPLLLRFLSTSLGYQYLDGLDYIMQEMDDWFLGRNDKYVTLVEASLDRALSNQLERPKSVAEESLQRHDAGFVPPHFYRELTRTREGCKLLKKSGHFRDFVATIKESWSEDVDSEAILKVKGCLWAVGHIGSMELGAPFLEESDVVSWIIRITEESQVITMRGTAFFVLGLISRSLHGMEILAEHGWDAATDQMGYSLGYCLPPALDNLFLMTILPAVRSEDIMHISLENRGHLGKDDDPVKAHALSLIIDLGNAVLTPRAAAELHSIRLKTPGVFSSIPLFRKAMSIIECHAFRLPVRRFVIDLFDKHLMRQIVLEEDSDDESDTQRDTAKPFPVH